MSFGIEPDATILSILRVPSDATLTSELVLRLFGSAMNLFRRSC